MSSKSELAKTSLEVDIQDGNYSDQFLGHLAESGLGRQETIEKIAQMAEAAAKRQSLNAQIVNKSVKGVEDLVGGADFEEQRAISLNVLARKLRQV